MKTTSKKIKKDSLLDRWLNREKKPETVKDIDQRPEDVDVPLSLGQQRLFFLQQLYPENHFYNYADTYRFSGKLNPDYLIRSFETVAQHHEILRTGFQIKDGQAIQIISPDPALKFSSFDLRNSSTDENRFSNAKDIVIKEAQKVFDLNSGSLTRISIICLADEDFLIGLAMHHIIGDEWSLKILLKEVAETYQKLCNGEKTEVSPLDIQYADYAFWQNKQTTDAQNLSYWKEKLENSLDFLDLPTDFPRPTRPTFKGDSFKQKLGEDLSEKLQTLCKKTKTTPFVLLLSAYKILLHRYTGETDILIGSPFTNRDLVKLEELIGFFNDTLVLRCDLSENPRFTDLLEQVNETVQKAFSHKNMPFETLVKSLKPERYLNYNPLFQTMFIYQDATQLPSFGENLIFEREEFDFGISKFDLTLTISEEDRQEISASFEYATDLFDRTTIERMHGHFQNLLGAIVDNPNRHIADLPIITDEELQLFAKWNNPNSTKSEAKSINELFEEQVKSNPQNIAVSFQGETLTYEELNKRANSVANYLLKLKLSREKPVGLFVEPSLEMIVGIVGILKAGLAYLPLDAQYPKKRIEFILQDSETSAVLTQKHLSNKIIAHFIEVQTFEEIFASENPSEPTLPESINKNDLAYVIYTSGSTGQPKGVSVTHKNLAYSNGARFDFYPNQPKSFLLLSSFSFDSSIVGIFWTLTTGGKLVVTERRIEQDLNCLAKTIELEKITHTLLLPTLYSLFLNNIDCKQLDSFETVIVAGEECPASLCREHFESLPNVKLYNEYGPTEATVWVTGHEIRIEDADKFVPIGKAISDTQIYILDKNQHRVPIGVWGEMYIGGKGVANGYLNNPNLTNKSFVLNPFSNNNTNRLYRTGDLCRYRPNGIIEFLGRIDNQVKIRGYRIELGEIQETIKQIPQVQDAFIKMEDIQKNAFKTRELDSDKLIKELEKMNFEEADEILKSVEKLSDKEIDFMLNETERV